MVLRGWVILVKKDAARLGSTSSGPQQAAYNVTTTVILPQRTAASGRQRADSSGERATAAWAQMQPSSSSSTSSSCSSAASSSASASAARRAARMAVPRDIEASASTRAACAHSARSRPICAGVWGDSYSYSWWMDVCVHAGRWRRGSGGTSARTTGASGSQDVRRPAAGC